MPSPMIHLLTAYRYQPIAPALFWVGNNAPDAIHEHDRAHKDAIHLRGVADRWAALRNMAAHFDPSDAFKEGWLLHLFADACWDEGPLLLHYETFTPAEDWFHTYRKEVSMASSFLYHFEPWAQDIWLAVLAAPPVQTDIPLAPSAADIAAYMLLVAQMHAASLPTPSTAFPPALVQAFAAETATRYRAFRAENPFTKG